jgi:hypothetical protein
MPQRHNVVEGRFLGPASHDWAVLCSRQRVSAVLVFPNGALEGMQEIGTAEDIGFLQGGFAGDGAQFSRVIGAVGADYITLHYEQYEGPTPPPIDHDGINDAFIEKGSVVRYWYRGRWLGLAGAD